MPITGQSETQRPGGGLFGIIDSNTGSRDPTRGIDRLTPDNLQRHELQRMPIELAVDLQGLAELSRATRHVTGPGRSGQMTMVRHELDSLEWLSTPNEDGFTVVTDPRDSIQTEVHAIDEIHVSHSPRLVE
jgi:hypothetical protein